MLSFLREQEIEDSSARKPSATAGGISADSTGQIQRQEYITVAAQGRNVRKTTTLLAVLFGIGLLCVWFMIKKTAPQAAVGSTEEARIEMAITRLTGVRTEMFDGLEKIVNKFYEFSNVRQVKADELVKNPFKHEMFLGDLKDIDNTEEGNSDINAEMMRQRRLAQQAENMQLSSIMQSDTGNFCMIDDKILYEADSIRGFKLCHISDSFVELELEGVKIVLKLSE